MTRVNNFRKRLYELESEFEKEHGMKFLDFIFKDTEKQIEKKS